MAPTPLLLEDDDSDEEQSWEVEALVGKRRVRGKVEYEVKWKGSFDSTWEPIENLNCEELVEAYEQTHRQEEQQTKNQQKVRMQLLLEKKREAEAKKSTQDLSWTQDEGSSRKRESSNDDGASSSRSAAANNRKDVINFRIKKKNDSAAPPSSKNRSSTSNIVADSKATKPVASKRTVESYSDDDEAFKSKKPKTVPTASANPGKLVVDNKLKTNVDADKKTAKVVEKVPASTVAGKPKQQQESKNIQPASVKSSSTSSSSASDDNGNESDSSDSSSSSASSSTSTASSKGSSSTASAGRNNKNPAELPKPIGPLPSGKQSIERSFYNDAVAVSRKDAGNVLAPVVGAAKLIPANGSKPTVIAQKPRNASAPVNGSAIDDDDDFPNDDSGIHATSAAHAAPAAENDADDAASTTDDAEAANTSSFFGVTPQKINNISSLSVSNSRRRFTDHNSGLNGSNASDRRQQQPMEAADDDDDDGYTSPRKLDFEKDIDENWRVLKVLSLVEQPSAANSNNIGIRRGRRASEDEKNVNRVFQLLIRTDSGDERVVLASIDEIRKQPEESRVLRDVLDWLMKHSVVRSI